MSQIQSVDLIEVNQTVAGLQVQKDWLKGQSLQNYRNYMHLALEKAQIQFQMRQKNLIAKKEQLEKRIHDITTKKIEEQAPQIGDHEYKTIDPELPNFLAEKLKLQKISRNCQKKVISRYFNLDNNTESLVYYKKETDLKPKKSIKLGEAKITVEKYSDYKKQPEDYQTSKSTKWNEENQPVRLKIQLKSRKFLPIFYYSDSLHQAVCLKTTIESILSEHNSEDISYLIKSLALVYQMNQMKLGVSILNKVRQMRFQKMGMFKCLEVHSKQFAVSRRDGLQIMLEAEFQQEPKIPVLRSTLKCGFVKLLDYFNVKTYSKVERLTRKIAIFARDGDIPYFISDVNDISGIKVENDNLVIYDRKKHEYHVPLSEIAYICSDIPYNGKQKDQKDTVKIQLRGRKINQNIETIGENILPQQLGLERIKHSRFVMKPVMKFSLKNIQIPLPIQEQLNRSVANEKDRIMYRLKIEVGEFYCYTPLFWTKKTSNVELKEDLTIDLNEARYIKITLLAVKGRYPPNNQYVNELVNEQVVSFVSLRINDFEEENSNMMHNINFNQLFYSPKDAAKNKNDPSQIMLQSALVIINVNGASPTWEMQGNQLLIGKYAIYKKNQICRILKANKNNTCSIEIIANDHQKVDNVSVKNDLKLCEEYGISVYNIDSPPQNYQHGQFEWSLDLLLNQQEQEFLSKLQEAISSYQVKLIYQQRLKGGTKKSKNNAFVCGTLHLSILNCQNLQNSDKSSLCDTFVQISVQDSKNQSNSKFIDIANEGSFIECKKNSEKMSNKSLKTTVVQQNNNPSWVTKNNPQGAVFDIGMFMKKNPHFILIEIYHQKKKSRFSSETENELIGFAELNTEDLISIDNYGTIDRLNLDMQKSVFKNAQSFLFYKVLHTAQAQDDYGYSVPLGKYLLDFFFYQDPSSTTPQGSSAKDLNQSVMLEGVNFQNRYERFSPEHKKHIQMKSKNPMRPKIEENVYLFKQLWLYTQFQNRNQALMNRQRVFWEEYMNDLMTSDADQGLIEDELKSIRSKLTNTTKMISSKYKKRSRQTQGQETKRTALEGETKGSKFSALFIGQWEKLGNWKYVDIWYLVKFGVPSDLRVNLWKDLLRRQIYEQKTYVYIGKDRQYKDYYNENLSVYANLVVLANIRDSVFYQQLEHDIKEFTFPLGYLKGNQARDDRMEEERSQLYSIFKVYGFWAHEFSKRSNQVMVYNNGMLSIVQRFLTLMSEEDAFWTLVGIVKAFNNVLTNNIKEPKESLVDHYTAFCPFLNRRTSYKNEMTIINCCIKLHFPQVFEHLKSLSIPIEWYFYEGFSTFYSSVFSTDLVLRLWDMMILNLSTNQIDHRKRALWYLLAIPLYMIQVNHDLILQTQNPIKIKDIMFNNTASLNYNPNIFIQELLSVIKSVFVIKEGLLNKILKNDKPYQLEEMRKEIEVEFQKNYSESQQISKKIASHILEKDTNLQVKIKKSNYQQQQLDAITVTLKVIGFRNILEAQLEDEIAQLQITVNGDEQVKSKPFEIHIPTDNELALFQILNEPIEIVTKLQSNMQYKDLKIQLTQIENGIHQNSLGTGIINISDFTSQVVEQYLSLKLQGNMSLNNAYIDLHVSVQQKKRPEKTLIQGLLIPDTDLYTVQKDQEAKRQFKDIIDFKQVGNDYEKLYKVIQSNDPVYNMCSDILSRMKFNVQDRDLAGQQINWTDYYSHAFEPKKQINGVAYLNNLINVSQHLVQNLDLQEQAEHQYSQLLIKFLIHGLNLPTDQFLEQLYQIFEKSSKQEFAKLIYHIYQASHYPLSINEVSQLLNISLYYNYSYVVKVTIQQSNQQEKNKNNNFQIFDVTNSFRQSLNQAIRVSGLSQYVDMRQEPFNNINLWLKNNSNVKKVTQVISVSMADNHGDQQVFRFKFNSNGSFSDSLVHNSILPISLNGFPIISREDFNKAILKTFPLFANFFRQRIFLKEQLYGSQEVYVDSPQPYRITFNSSNKKFLFIFSSNIDKENDFTVDPSQLMRIAKGDTKKIYRKSLQDSEVIEVSLSSLSKQDTFLRIKQRMRMALDFIVQSENINGLPNIMSEKFQFKRITQIENDFYPSMNRLIDVKETSFDLIRVNTVVQDNDPYSYSSYALYTHPNGLKEWRPCKILLKIPGHNSDSYKIEFLHEKGQYTYQFAREDLLLSFDYKRSQENYYKEEVQEFLDKLDKDEAKIAELFRDQDRAELEDVKKQIQFEKEDGIRINVGQFEEEKDEEIMAIRKAMDMDL